MAALSLIKGRKKSGSNAFEAYCILRTVLQPYIEQLDLSGRIKGIAMEYTKCKCISSSGLRTWEAVNGKERDDKSNDFRSSFS